MQYVKVGGRKGDSDAQCSLNGDEDEESDGELIEDADVDNNEKGNKSLTPKIFSKKRLEGQVTSRIGDLLT